MNNYTITPEALETIENMILYYDTHGADNIAGKHPGWVIDDLEKLLATLNGITETI